MILDTNTLVGIMVLAYGAAFLSSIMDLTLKRKSLEKVGLALLIVAFAFNTWAVAGRWVEAGRPPFKTMYETLIFYPWCVVTVTFVLVAMHRLFFLIPFAAGAALIGLIYALFRPDMEILNLPPALQSAWFVPHVVTYFVAYAALFASFALALTALVYPRWNKRRGHARNSNDDSLAKLELYAHQAAVFGIVTLTLGLVLGAAWGKMAWGEYWSWDPKENWALVCWLAYMLYLHLRLISGWREQKAMWVLVMAFAAVIFTYLGINLLPTAGGSLHSYQ